MTTRSAQRHATRVRRCELYEEAAAIIDLEYPGALALDDIARRLASSPRQLQRAFAEVGQTSFRSHLQRVRMQRAAQMLAAGTAVSEVARKVGYRQPAQFTRAFHAQHRVLPSAVKLNERPAAGDAAGASDLAAAAHSRPER